MSQGSHSFGNVLIGKYASLKRLGRSIFGEVFLVEEGKGGPKWALKVIDKKLMCGKSQFSDHIMNEVDCMKEMTNQHIVQLKDVLEDDEHIYLVFEYCDGKSLIDLQAIQPNSVFTIEQATECLSQVILGLEALHKQGHIHGEIRPHKILIKNERGLQVIAKQIQVFKISLSGFAKLSLDLQFMQYQQMKAPEIFRFNIEEKQKMYGCQVDIWALGVLLFFMLNLSYPFIIDPYLTLQDKYREICKQSSSFSYRRAVANTKKKSMDNCNDEMEDIFKRIFCINQKQRITITELRNHPIFISYFSKENISKNSIYSSKQEQTKIFFAKEQQLLHLEMEGVNFLSEIANDFQSIQRVIGLANSLMLRFNLIKYHIVLFKNFYHDLTANKCTKKYPGMHWDEYFLSSEFAKAKIDYIVAMNNSKQHFSELYKMCKKNYKQICNINEYFSLAFREKITQEELSGSFFSSYRKSTDIVYTSLKQCMKSSNDMKLYNYFCITCIVHVFNDLYESEQLKRSMFSAFLSQVSEITAKGQLISFRKVANYLRGSSKQAVLSLAKQIINGIMIKK